MTRTLAAVPSASDVERPLEPLWRGLLVYRILTLQIGERLGVSHRTVESHVQNTLRKLQLHNRVQLVRYAIEQGLADD